MSAKVSTGMRVFETQANTLGYNQVAGVDEAGRGPLAGPVVAAACVFPESVNIEGINDSKKLSAKKRLELFEKITNHPDIVYSIAFVNAELIDEINILQATLLAMTQAVNTMCQKPDFLLIDGNMTPKIDIPSWAIPKGDQKSLSIAAASILAKVTRDRKMIELSKQWPQFCFENNNGYGTKAHMLAIETYGICEIHRKSFEPIKSLLKNKPTVS